MLSTLSHFSILQCSAGTQGRLVFPGQKHLSSIGTFGYVRSNLRARWALAHTASENPSNRPLPWRDYSSAVLTDAAKVVDVTVAEPRIVISARNVLNEFGYRARIGGVWWTRLGDSALDLGWPVLTFSSTGLQMQLLAEAESGSADILTGIPLVHQQRPLGRDFLIACCSDVAHSYEVHPQGLIGPSQEAWQILSNAWEEGKANCLSNKELTSRLQQIAIRYDAAPSRNLLHSIVGQCSDGSLLFVGITGALSDIAQLLINCWDVEDAIILDNGGSVGWLYYPGNGREPILLLAGPNRRAEGTVFLELFSGEFLQPKSHSVFS